eukprot:4252653-Amphidinium_carterae.1
MANLWLGASSRKQQVKNVRVQTERGADFNTLTMHILCAAPAESQKENVYAACKRAQPPADNGTILFNRDRHCLVPWSLCQHPFQGTADITTVHCLELPTEELDGVTLDRRFPERAGKYARCCRFQQPAQIDT